MEAYASAAGLVANADSIKDLYLKRQLIRRMSGLVDNAYRSPDKFKNLVELASADVLALSRNADGSSVHSMENVIEETLEAIAERQTNPEVGVQTGFQGLDNRLMSLRKGGLYVLAARPGVGKTSFALSVVDNVLQESSDHVLFFLEVDRVDLVKKMLTGSARLDFAKIESGLLSPEETDALTAAADELRGKKLDLMDVSGPHGAESAFGGETAPTEVGEDKLALVVIDYLQLLLPRVRDRRNTKKYLKLRVRLRCSPKSCACPWWPFRSSTAKAKKAGSHGRPRCLTFVVRARSSKMPTR